MSLRIGPTRRVAVLLVAVLLAGCGQQGAVRSDDATGGVTAPGELSAFEVRLGDCFMDDLSESFMSQVENIEAVPCDEPHRNEVYALFDLPDGEFPGEDEVVQLSEEGCFERFPDYVGTDPQESRLNVGYLFPTQQSWDTRNDREVTCAVSDPAGDLKDSVEGVGEDYALPGAGDCVNQEDNRIPVSCKKKHDAEIYRVAQLKGKKFPGESKLNTKVERLCVKAFERYVGTPYSSSELGVQYFTPSQETWDAGDRRAICAVSDATGQLKGSVKDSGR
jgi:hypothetical protein